MTLKEQMAADLDVFLCADEFAEEHDVDGVSMTCVIDASGLEEMAADSSGVAFASVVYLYARTTDLAALHQGSPKVNRLLDVDGDRYLVISVADDEGLTRVGMTIGRS